MSKESLRVLKSRLKELEQEYELTNRETLKPLIETCRTIIKGFEKVLEYESR